MLVLSNNHAKIHSHIYYYQYFIYQLNYRAIFDAPLSWLHNVQHFDAPLAAPKPRGGAILMPPNPEGVQLLMPLNPEGVQFMMPPNPEGVQFLMPPNPEGVQFLMHTLWILCFKNTEVDIYLSNPQFLKNPRHIII